MVIDICEVRDIIAIFLQPANHHHFPSQEKAGADLSVIVRIGIDEIGAIERYLVGAGPTGTVESIQRSAASCRSWPVIVRLISCDAVLKEQRRGARILTHNEGDVALEAA